MQVNGMIGRVKLRHMLGVMLWVGLWLAVSTFAGCEPKKPKPRHIELHEQVHDQIIPKD